MMWDMVIAGGEVIDGTGTPRFHADVVISGGRIGAVAPGLHRELARRRIDAAGLVVCPGFVDMHTHYDGQVTWDPQLTPSGWHGCTTAFGSRWIHLENVTA